MIFGAFTRNSTLKLKLQGQNCQFHFTKEEIWAQRGNNGLRQASDKVQTQTQICQDPKCVHFTILQGGRCMSKRDAPDVFHHH